MRQRACRTSQAARGTEQGAGEPAQSQPGQVPGPEPAQLAELAITDNRGAPGDAGLINTGDIRDTVAVRVTDLVVRPAEYVQQAHQLNIDADLLAGLPDAAAAGDSPTSTAPPRTPHPSSWPA